MHNQLRVDTVDMYVSQNSDQRASDNLINDKGGCHDFHKRKCKESSVSKRNIW